MRGTPDAASAATCSRAPARGGSSTTASNRFELGRRRAGGEKDRDARRRPAGPRALGRGLERQRGVARRPPPHRPCRRAPARRCRGRRKDPRPRRAAHRLAHRRDQRRLAIRRRLQEAPRTAARPARPPNVTVAGSGSHKVCGPMPSSIESRASRCSAAKAPNASVAASPSTAHAARAADRRPDRPAS